jgi:hypothetical protein
LPCFCRRRLRLVTARSSHDFACCRRAISMARRKQLSASVRVSVREQASTTPFFALAFERPSRREGLLGQVARRVGARVRWRSWLRDRRKRFPALAAELNPGRVIETAARTLQLQQCPALTAELYTARVVETAGWAAHRRSRGGRQHPRATGIQATGTPTASPSIVVDEFRRADGRSRRTVASETSATFVFLCSP